MNYHVEIMQFIKGLHHLGIDASHVSLSERSETRQVVICDSSDPHARMYSSGEWLKSVPRLTIFVKTTVGFRVLHIDERSGHWGTNDPRMKEIRNLWRSLVMSGSKPLEAYDDDMPIYIRDGAKHSITDAVYGHLDPVVELVHHVSAVTPEHVYRCTRPGYNILYKAREDYYRAEASGDFKAISDAVLQLMLERVEEATLDEVRLWLSVRFHHPEEPGYNSYGFARED